jgi:dolichol-phosphate mannosyltransferase
MILCQDARVGGQVGKVSLILPLAPGEMLPGKRVAEYREILERQGTFEAVEVIVARGVEFGAAASRAPNVRLDDEIALGATYVSAEGRDWSALVRAGLGASTGEHLVVLDVKRHYSPDSLTRVVAPLQSGECDLAVAVAHSGEHPRPRVGFGMLSRKFLGTSDVFSGLFALERSVWERAGRAGTASGPSPVLDTLIRRPARCIDVPVAVDDRFRSHRYGLADLRPLKHLVDSRFGNYSRLVQFCMVGASGMVVDLSFYALWQWLLSFTTLADRTSAFFGCSWHLAIAAAISIAVALVWNFTLNRRLTFNDARKGSILRQFLTYALSNGLAIALSFSVRLFLPSRVGFFARHRLAAAVVGIVAATGISFSMARWFVFVRRPDPGRGHRPLDDPTILQPASSS